MVDYSRLVAQWAGLPAGSRRRDEGLGEGGGTWLAYPVRSRHYLAQGFRYFCGVRAGWK